MWSSNSPELNYLDYHTWTKVRCATPKMIAELDEMLQWQPNSRPINKDVKGFSKRLKACVVAVCVVSSTNHMDVHVCAQSAGRHTVPPVRTARHGGCTSEAACCVALPTPAQHYNCPPSLKHTHACTHAHTRTQTQTWLTSDCHHFDIHLASNLVFEFRKTVAPSTLQRCNVCRNWFATKQTLLFDTRRFCHQNSSECYSA